MKIAAMAAAVVASVLAMMLLAPPDAAQARASGARGFHFPVHHPLARHRLPLHGGYLTLSPYDPSVTYALHQPIEFVREQRGCRYDRQVVTVAAEQGGTRQITITRC